MKLVLTSLFILITTGISVYCQDSYVDSLEKILTTKITDSHRAKIYIDLAEYIPEENVWMEYNRKGLDLANKKLESLKGEERKHYLIVKANAIGNLGYYYDDHGDKAKSLKYYYQSLEIYEEADFQIGKASIYGNIGIILSDQGDLEEALDYYNKSLEIKLKYTPDDVAKAYVNIAVVLEDKGEIEEALEYYNKALSAARKVNDIDALSTILNNIGAWHYKQKKYRKAIPFLAQAIEFSKQKGDEAGSAWSMGNIGTCYLNIEMIDSAYFYTLKAEVIADRYEYPELTQAISEKLVDLYLNDKNWELAYKYKILANKMDDSLKNIDEQKQVLTEKLNFDHNLETVTVALQREEEIKREEQRLYFILGGLALTIFFVFMINARLRVTKRQKAIIEEQKIEVEFKNKEILDSINYAKRLQNAIFPSEDGLLSHFSDAFLLYLPKDIVAGDFYWAHKDENTIYIAVADCTGHGVPGAMISVVCANALDRVVKEMNCNTTAEILDNVTDLVIQQFEESADEVKDGMDIALCKLDFDTLKIEFSGAFNPFWRLKSNSTEVEVIKGNRQSIGASYNREPFTTQSIQCNKGDWIYLFSDGYADQFGGVEKESRINGGKKYKTANLKNLIMSNLELTGDEQKNVLLKSHLDWRQEIEQVDDICVFGFKI